MSSICSYLNKFGFAFRTALILIIQLLGLSFIFRAEEETLTPEQGKKVFEDAGCFVCHGNEGIGGVRNRNSATSEQIPSLTYTSRGYDDASLKQRILRGSVLVRKLDPRGITPPVSMPSFRGLLSEDELTNLIVYLRSLTPEEDEEPREVSSERPPVPEYMVKKNSCQICHGIVTEQFKKNSHYAAFVAWQAVEDTIVCAGCHGDGVEHAKKYGDPAHLTLFTKDAVSTVEQKNRKCLQCHQRGNQMSWNNSVHEINNLTCVDCHKNMQPASAQNLLVRTTEMETCFQCHQQRRAQSYRSSHMPMREGKVTCSDCHNSHGTSNEKLLREPTVNENCYRCHAEKRGPFLWEHPPVAENCLNCHEPHGTMRDKLLTVMLPRLCQQCHIGSEEHSTTPQLASARYVINRSCVNCHSQIHGSNHPSGVRFHR